MNTPSTTRPVPQYTGPEVGHRVDANCGPRLCQAFHPTYSARETASLSVRRPGLQTGQQRTGTQVPEARSPRAPVLGPSPANGPHLLFFLRLRSVPGVCCVDVLEGECVLPKFLPYRVGAGFPTSRQTGEDSWPR